MRLQSMRRSEDTEQIKVIMWAKSHESECPELKWLHHIPNGGSRSKAEAVKLKQMGVKSGVSDLHLPYPKGAYCTLYIEMKYGKNGLEKTQRAFLKDMAEAGAYVATCYSAQTAIDVIEEYLKLDPEQEMTMPNNTVWREV